MQPSDWKRVYPYAPLASHVVGYMGAITADDRGSTTAGPRLQHVDRRRARRPCRRRAVDGDRAARHVGQGQVLRGRRRRPHRARGQRRRPPVDRQGHPADDRPRPAAVRRAAAADPARASSGLFTRARTPRSTKPDGTPGPARRTSPSGTAVSSTRRPAGSRGLRTTPTGQIMAMASYPTFDNRWFSSRRRGDKFDEIFADKTTPTASPTPTSRCSSTARSRASTTWARRSSRSSPTPR